MGATDATCEAQREAAIVTAIPGTTRDVLEISLDIDGLLVVVADTAGLRAADDVVERIGIQRAAEAYVHYTILVLRMLAPYTNGCADWRRVRNADVSVCVLSLSDIEGVSVPPEVVRLVTPNTVFLLNKADLIPGKVENVDLTRVVGQAHSWRVSAATGDGMKDFLVGFGKVLHGR